MTVIAPCVRLCMAVTVFLFGCMSCSEAESSPLGCIPVVALPCSLMPVLGGSWVVISGVRSPLRWVINIVTLLITTPKP